MSAMKRVWSKMYPRIRLMYLEKVDAGKYIEAQKKIGFLIAFVSGTHIEIAFWCLY